MSTKTLRKRIALVAVATLGAGVLSVAPANATALANSLYDTVSGTVNPVFCSVTSTDGSEAIVLPLGVDFVLSGGGANMEVNDTYKFSMPGTTIVGLTTAAVVNRTEVFSADRSSVSSTNTTSAAAGITTLTFRAATVGDYVLTISERDVSTSAAFADIEAISVSWVTTCANNVYSAADSLIQVRDDTSAAGTTTSVDEPTGLLRGNGQTAYIALATEDSYGSALSGAGSLIATATNGAVINWDSAPSIQTSTAYLGTRGATGTELYVTQGVANANKPLTTTVSITLDGTVIGTKTITFLGVPASIVISGVKGGKIGGTNIFDARVLDAAGNGIPSQTVENDATANAATSVATISSGVTQSAVTHTDGGATSSTNPTRGNYNCTAAGKTSINVKTVLNAITGTSIKASFPVTCAGGLATWTASLDKASYAPGEIATLTVSGKDSKGFEVNAIDTLGTLEQSFGGMAFVTAPTTADKFDSALGSKTYTLAVGTSEGAFVGTFKITGTTDTAAKTVLYRVVAPSTGAVSNADVLKAIVSLIASINKQIAALQKALLKR